MHAFETTLESSMDAAEESIREALASEGFGVLTEMDVAATLRTKLGIDRPPLKILGACNPSFANRALELDPSLALVLPCNVVLEDVGAGRTRVAVVDPSALVTMATAVGETPGDGEQSRSAPRSTHWAVRRRPSFAGCSTLVRKKRKAQRRAADRAH